MQIQAYINPNVFQNVNQTRHAKTQEHFRDATQIKDIVLNVKLTAIAH